MRVWMTRLSIPETLVDLDDQRLIAQHREAVGMLQMSAGSDETLHRFRNNSLGKQFKDHHDFLFQIHDWVVVEMENRGFFGHKTPISKEDFPNYQPGLPFAITPERVAFDRADLVNRYLVHSNMVLQLRRKDRLRWTKRDFPDWIPEAVLKEILAQDAFLKSGRK